MRILSTGHILLLIGPEETMGTIPGSAVSGASDQDMSYETSANSSKPRCREAATAGGGRLLLSTGNAENTVLKSFYRSRLRLPRVWHSPHYRGPLLHRIFTIMRSPARPLLLWISGGPLSTVSVMRCSVRPPLRRTAGGPLLPLILTVMRVLGVPSWLPQYDLFYQP